jgi:hypothetical protein
MRKLIYVASPLKGDYEGNMEKAREYCRYVMSKGHIPFAPHLLFTQFLNDEVPEERQAGMQMGLDMLPRCDELWAFGGLLTGGMLREILEAEELGLTVRRITLSGD